uniref:Uncharacterized protein n=1 Tax=Lactuca sativa TaxID=4236 RepID=A0A9R1WCV3_LACSA|nr:hypothetical protein LSAT_V11C200081220 [Lactuca sativa]
MANGSNSKFRRQLVKNDSKPSQHLTTGVLWGFYWCMMLPTNHLSTVSFFYLIMNDTLLTNLFISPDIRNRIRNIEQHASNNVNKILVGNKL